MTPAHPDPATAKAHATEKTLLRHLGWVVALKLLVLAGLWQAFVAEQRVAVDEAAVAAHQLGAAAAATAAAAPASTSNPPLEGERP